MSYEPIKIVSDQKGRVDKVITNLSEFSRTDIQKLIEAKAITVNGNEVRKPNFTVQEGDDISVNAVIPKEINAVPEKIDIDIVFEDEYLAVINKKSGMVVHPAPGHHNGTLVNALLYHFKDLSRINGPVRPGIVHRIDKDTSGLLIIAKDEKAHKILAEALKQHDIKRVYHALVRGRPSNEIIHINLPIGRDKKYRKRMKVQSEKSKHAITHVYVEKIFEKRSLVRCELETGRTHQIRVHLAHIGHPVIGDPLYGKEINEFGQRLHAAELEFIHPITKKKMNFKIDEPKEFWDEN